MNHPFLNVALAFAILFILLRFSFAENDTIFVGTLETKFSRWPDTEYRNEGNLSTKKIVRVLFMKSGDRWISMCDSVVKQQMYPKSSKWYIAFDGRKLGHFSSKMEPLRWKNYSWTFPRDAHHLPVQKNLPTVGKPTSEFAGEPGGQYPRPLIVVSKDNCKDPERWKPFIPPKHLVDSLIPLYWNTKGRRSITGKVEAMKSYCSNKNDALIQLATHRRTSAWFYVSNDGFICNLTKLMDKKYELDEFGDDDESSASLVDAGDYDGDGQSEIIFFVSRYVQDGYVMFFDNCSSIADFTWIYH